MCADCRAPEEHKGPHPALAARKRYLGGGQPEEFGGNAAVAAPGYPYPPGWLYPGVPDWHYPGPRYIGADWPEAEGNG